jgi:hypothetical protein
MTLRSTARWTLLAAIACLAVACGEPKTSPGPDNYSGSDASVVPWSDGKSAIAITCNRPGGCQQRAQALCPRGYTTLKSVNMPVAGGNAIMLPDSGISATVRCNA